MSNELVWDKSRGKSFYAEPEEAAICIDAVDLFLVSLINRHPSTVLLAYIDHV